MRPVNESDLESVLRLVDLAFVPSRLESRLVKALVQKGRQLYQWVLESEDSLTAYACYSQAYREQRSIGFHLAPVAVHPEHQGKGIGSLIIRETLRQPPIAGSSVFVLGRPSYYTRFGFRRVTHPTCPFNPSNHHFLALNYEPQDEFCIGYEPEFINTSQAAPTEG
jgi:putative acetyltransferase